MPKRIPKFPCICKGCGQRFYRSANEIARGRDKYCSHACYLTICTNRIEITCQACNRAVSVPRSYVERGQYKYCSELCRRNRNSTEAERTRVCKTCGRSFQISDVAKPRFHCSLNCRRRRVMVTCAQCGYVFERKRSQGSARFCSRGCYLKATESQLQRQVREALDSLHIGYEEEKAIGRYNVDFYLPAFQAVLEVDGTFWHTLPAQQQRDAVRETKLMQRGLRVARITQKALKRNPVATVEEVIHALAAG